MSLDWVYLQMLRLSCLSRLSAEEDGTFRNFSACGSASDWIEGSKRKKSKKPPRSIVLRTVVTILNRARRMTDNVLWFLRVRVNVYLISNLPRSQRSDSLIKLTQVSLNNGRIVRHISASKA